MDWDWVQNLAAVALGGLLASAAGRSTARRENRAEAMETLTVLRSIQSDPDALSNMSNRDRERQARAALLAAGVRWSYVEMATRLTAAIMRANWDLLMAKRQSGIRADYAHRLTHPSRWRMRPMIQLADVLEQIIAESLERPVRARLLAPLREWQFRATLRTVRKDNEVTRMPPIDILPGHSLYDPETFLCWPNRKLLRIGAESPRHVPDSYWPQYDNDDERDSGERPLSSPS